MANRRIARSSRLKQKKREKKSKKESLADIRDDRGNEEQMDVMHGSKGRSSGIKKKPNQIQFRTGERKQKAGVSSRSSAAGPGVLRLLKKKKSALLKRHAAERMVLKERLRELTEKKNRLRRGENVKVERRELSKYIRQLREQLVKKHEDDLSSVEKDIQAAQKPKGSRHRRMLAPGVPATLYRHQQRDEDWVDEASTTDSDSNEEDETVQEEDMIQMFSHLTA